MNNEKANNYNTDFSQNKKKLTNEIDYIEILVNALNTEVDEILGQLDNIEKLVDIKPNSLN